MAKDLGVTKGKQGRVVRGSLFQLLLQSPLVESSRLSSRVRLRTRGSRNAVSSRKRLIMRARRRWRPRHMRSCMERATSFSLSASCSAREVLATLGPAVERGA